MIKNHQQSPSRGSFAWTVLLIILLASFAFITLLNNSKSSAISSGLDSLRYEDDNYQRLDTCIAILYDAENNSRFFIVTSDSSYLNKYKKQLGLAGELLSRFETENESRSKQFSRLVNSKDIQYQEFLNLRLMLDSLLIYSEQKPVQINRQVARKTAKVILRETTSTEVKDSLVVSTPKTKKRLLKRIADAISNKENEGSTVAYSETRVDKGSVEEAGEQPTAIERFDQLDSKDKYSIARRELSVAEQKILTTNGRIFQQLQVLLKELKEKEKLHNDALRQSLLSATSVNLQDVNHLYRASVLIVMFLAIIIISNLVKLYKNGQTILRYAKETEETTRKKGEFITQLTHEIRTPLNSIIGFSHLIDSKELDGELRTSVGAIKNSSKILLSLVNEILDFAKYESGKMELVENDFVPAELLEQTVDMISVLAAEKQIEIRNQSSFDTSLVLHGDDFRIKQLVINLVNNALKFTPTGGAVYVNSDYEVLEGKGLLKIVVKDTGVGIAPENLEKIFENFVQVKSPGDTASYLGTGLGLAICKRIVDLFEGEIRVTSTVGEGSTFTIVLPIKKVDINQKEVTGNTTTLEVTLAGKKLLIVDDTKINLLLISKIMDKNRIGYDLATDGKKALELFENHYYDLVITDVHMPEMDGLELTQRIRISSDKTKANLPVLGLTGSSSAESRGEYIGVGMNEVLGKPFEEKELLDLLGRLLVQVEA